MMAAEDGKTIEREIKSPEQAVLWLWRAHNKANRRLSGDLTDDRAFPKETFPNLQHCTHCYDDQALGSDLW
jgi:thiol oxidase